MTTTESQAPAGETAPLIEELFCQGHAFEHVVSTGAEIGWTRDDVNAVLRDRQWDLDGSGRLPRSKRITAPRGLRAARPTAPAAPVPAGRRLTPVERPQRAVIDTPPLDDWVGPDGPVVDLVPDDDAGVEPAEAPAAVQPPAEVFSAIAEWADSDEATAVAPAPAPALEEAPKPRGKRRPAPARPSAPDPSDGIVERFLAERTIPAPADQFLTSPQLREAFEEWRGTADAPAVSPRRFGSAMSARYGKRQATVVIDGVKPMCYFGLAWKPVAPTSWEPAAVVSWLDQTLIQEAQASVALDGETQVIGGAYTAAAPRVAEPEVSAEPAVTEEQVAAVHAELTAAAVRVPPNGEASPPAARAQTLDLLATGLAHADRRVRAAAIAVERAVDTLCATLSRAGHRG